MAVRQATAPWGVKRVFTKGRGWNMLSSRWMMTWGGQCNPGWLLGPVGLGFRVEVGRQGSGQQVGEPGMGVHVQIGRGHA